MNETTDTANDQITRKPNLALTVIYFAVLGGVYGALSVISIVAQAIQGNSSALIPLIIALIFPVALGIAAWGVGHYKKWGRILGLVLSGFFILATGFGAFRYLARVAGNFSMGTIIILLIYVAIFVASVLIARFLFNQKEAFI